MTIDLLDSDQVLAFTNQVQRDSGRDHIAVDDAVQQVIASLTPDNSMGSTDIRTPLHKHEVPKNYLSELVHKRLGQKQLMPHFGRHPNAAVTSKVQLQPRAAATERPSEMMFSTRRTFKNT